VLGHLPRILSMLSEIKRAMVRERPRAVVVIDAPDFHFRVIKIARSLGIPVYYYISPKVWAWRRGRAEFIREHVRRLISILPFEVEFYRTFGMEIDYVGNPLVDLVDYPSLERIAPEFGHVGFLPGSRKSEITSLLPEFGGAARIMLRHMPHLRFSCVRAPNVDESLLRSLWPPDVPVAFEPPDNRWALMRRCEMLIAASGTVTLESAIVGTPTIAVYKVSPISYAVGWALLKIPYMSLANLILGREVFPELLQKDCDAVPLATRALAWLRPPVSDSGSPDAPLALVRKELAEVRKRLGPPGAPDRAAAIILNDLRAATASNGR
jgi:lipid-A-disaccharide synthase